MSIFGRRNKIIFHIEDNLPDPLDQKFLFRKKVLFLTFLGAITILGIPIARDRMPAVQSNIATRELASTLQDLHLLMAEDRNAISMQLLENHRDWQMTLANTMDCSIAAQKNTNSPARIFTFPRVVWKFNQIEIHNICFHPIKGIFINHAALDGNSVIIQAIPAEDLESGRVDRIRNILLSNKEVRLANNLL